MDKNSVWIVPAESCMDKNSVWIDIIFSVCVYWDKTWDVQDQLCNLCTAIFINFVCFNNGFLLEYCFAHYVCNAKINNVVLKV